MPILLQGKGLGQLIFVAIFFLIFVILPAIMERLAKKRKEEQQRRQQPRPEPGRAKQAYQASPDEVKHYLKNVGGKTQQKPPQRPQPAPAGVLTTRTTTRTTERGRTTVTPVAETRREARAPSTADQLKRYLESIGVAVEPKPQQRPTARRQAPPPPPKRARRPAPPRPRPRSGEGVRTEGMHDEACPEGRSQLMPDIPSVASAKARAATAAAAAAAALEPIEATAIGSPSELARKPTVGELRRAVILAEVIRRPDFSRLPHERSQ